MSGEGELSRGEGERHVRIWRKSIPGPEGTVNAWAPAQNGHPGLPTTEPWVLYRSIFLYFLVSPDLYLKPSC